MKPYPEQRQCKHCEHPTVKPTWDKRRDQWQIYNHCSACRNFHYKHGMVLDIETRQRLEAEPYCHICGSTEKLHIDHNHVTKQFRDYLCYSCNYKLGWLAKHEDAINAYKEKHETIN